MIQESILAPVNSKNIRSKDRVRDLAEVFTSEREVNAMLDLVGDVTHLPETTFLEPSCGNGNFLVAIIDRKIETVFSRHSRQPDIEKALLRSLMSIYAVDICRTNVDESRRRVWGRVTSAWSFRVNTRTMSPEFVAAATAVLRRNIRVCDFLKGREGCVMTNYVGPISGKYVLKNFRLSDPAKTISSRGGVTLEALPLALCENGVSE